MINTLYLPELREMLESSDVEGLREFCTALHPARTAEFMEGLTATESWTVLQAADQPTRVEIFAYLDRQCMRGKTFGRMWLSHRGLH